MSTDPLSNTLQIHPLLLDQLLAFQHTPQLLHALAQSTQLSIAELQHELGRLAQAGCMIDQHPNLGVTLKQAGCATWVDYLQWKLGMHRQIVVYRQTPSTQDAARLLLTQHGASAHDAAVLADHQYAGRGRLGRTWLATPQHAVTFSLVHVAKSTGPAQQRPELDRLIFAAAVAVARGIEAASRVPLKASIKWPNDILLDSLKVAGILVETMTLRDGQQAAIIGVGINVGQTPDLSEVDPQRGKKLATSMAEHGPLVDRLHVISHVLQALDHALHVAETESLVADWRKRSILLSQSISFQTPQGNVQGEVIDIDASDGLIVRTNAGAILHLPAATTSIL